MIHGFRAGNIKSFARQITRQYFEPIEEGMPKNCSKDVAAVIKHVDEILLYGSETDKHKLKEPFGLWGLKDDDFGQ